MKKKANRGPSAGPENRRALLEAARAEFAEHGLSAPLSAVARRAGVGQGSLYRHFPDRIALAVAVFHENVAELEAAADREDSGLAELFDAVAEQAMASTALVELLMSAQDDERARDLGARVLRLVDRVLEREHAASRIADTVDRDDVMLAISMLAAVLARSDTASRPAIAARARAIFRSAFSGDASRARR